MKPRYTVALAMLAGVAVGGAAIQGLHAQAKPPTYVVIDVSEITDPEGYKANTQRPAGSTVTAKLGGRYIARSNKLTALDGTAPKRLVIIAFDSPEKVQAWYNSEEQKKVSAIRLKTTKSRSFIVEGM
jgi:uncharacterized protein (DUF1330 family)